MSARRGPPGALAAFLLLASVWLALPAQSQEGRVGISIAPVRVEFFKEDSDPKLISIFVKGDVAGTVELEMSDLVPAEREGLQQVGYGTTPSTLKGFLKIEPSSFRYVPNGTEQVFSTFLSIDPSVADDVRYGTLVATLQPKASVEGNAAQVVAGVAIKVLTAQAAQSIPPADLSLALDEISVTARQQWTIVDAVLPDIPGVIGHGPGLMAASGRNVGEYFLDEVTVFEVRRVSPLVLLPFIDAGEPRPILRVLMRPRYTVPGQRFRDETTTLIPLESGGEVDSLPFIGFVRVTARVTGTLGGAEALQDFKTKTVLVLPWSEGLAVVGIWTVLRGGRKREHASRGPRRRIMGVGEARRGRRVTDRFLRRQSGDPDQPTLF